MENNDQKQIAGAILIVGVLIAGAILLKDSNPQVVNAPVADNNTLPATSGRDVSQNEHIVGNADAEIVIVEYSDSECPFCKVFHNTMNQIVEEADGRVAWVYRHFPIPELHAEAFLQAEATECAWDQGGNDAFWKYTNRIFEVTTSNNGLDKSELPQIAEYTGLDVTTFNECLNSGKFTSKVQADIDAGVKAGVRGTPSSFIIVKGKVIDTIPGAQPYETLKARLDAIK
jgi:protein-disulfide isomerase